MDEESAPQNKPLVKRAQRDMRGRFQKGHSLATGRPKGAKNKATLVREEMEAKGTLMLGRVAPHILKKGMEMALEGDREMIKEFLARILPKSGNGKADVPDSIEVIINNLVAVGGKPQAPGQVIDAREVDVLEDQSDDVPTVVVETMGRQRVERS